MNCRICNVELNDENWYPSSKKNKECICKKCKKTQHKEWTQKNKPRLKSYQKQYHDKNIGKKIRTFFVHLWGDFCAICGTELNNNNWSNSRKKVNNRVCKRCDSKRALEWYIEKYGLRQKKNKSWGQRKDDSKKRYRKYFEENKADYVEYWAKRKGKGYIPLNEWFDGADGHHIDKEHVIFMPMFIHRCIPHHHKDPDSMWVINCMALLWLFYGSLPKVEMKLPDWIFKPLPEPKYKQLALF